MLQMSFAKPNKPITTDNHKERHVVPWHRFKTKLYTQVSPKEAQEAQEGVFF